MQHAASAITAPDSDQLPVYWQFHEAVTRAQLTDWLPSGRHLLVDVSGPRAPGAELAAKAGHTVVRVIEASRATRRLRRLRRRGGPGAEGAEAVPPKGGRGGLGERFPPRIGGVRGVAPPGQHSTAESSR